jgi:ketosteroid isomerase-like protein
MEQTEAVVRAYIEACNGDDKEAVYACLHPEVELHEPPSLPGAVSAVGLKAARHYLERFDVHWSSFRWEPLELRVAGSRALMPARLALRGRRSGLDVEREWVYVFEVRDGKLFRQYGFDDVGSAEPMLTGGR